MLKDNGTGDSLLILTRNKHLIERVLSYDPCLLTEDCNGAARMPKGGVQTFQKSVLGHLRLTERQAVQTFGPGMESYGLAGNVSWLSGTCYPIA